jgi:exodeoxyribonuclease V beta subunit
MTTFDLFAIPLTGTRLIEASAGTGKTYTIAGLFIRLLLEKGMTVDQILVVTYTQAATEELKTRIRSRIAEARDGFVAGGATDDLITAFLERFPDHRRAHRLLSDALADFDRAAIFTIHGFCQRILHENAFETGNLYDTELITDTRDLHKEIAEDFWRIHFYTAPAEWVSFAAHNGIRDPSDFERLLGGIHVLEASILPRLSPPELTSLQRYRQRFRRLVARWTEAREEVLELLRSQALDGRHYGSLQTAARPSSREVRLAAMAAEMDRFAGSPQPDFPPFQKLEGFTAGGLQRFTRTGHRPPDHDVFLLCDELQQTAQALEAEMKQRMLHLKAEYLRWARSESDRRKQSRNIRHYDDLLLAVKKALASSPDGNSQQLVRKVQKKYRAALVDEFQDTDAVQYEIVSAVFGSARELLFIIGDPKQSIYSFRGADIFSYLAAAAGADSRYTLQENWRSEPGLIKAVNTLFAGTPTPFLFDAITCDPIRPGLAPQPDTRSDPRSLVLWYLPPAGSKPLNKADAVAMISEAVGDEIAHLVNAAAEPVAPADIAVLVRTNRQAQIVKETLVKRDIPAVLYSTGSVFATREAAELVRVLTGVLHCSSESLFRSALATDMMGVSGDALIRADQQPLEWERRRHRFREYADGWKRLGFIRMFRTLLAREKVRGRLLAFDDGERRLTNLLHLGELLHREADARQLRPAALLRWLAERCRPDAPGSDEHLLRLESDELAVKIVTVHKSKGLEYPVVFCPFGWDGSTLRADGPVIFHSAEPAAKLTVDMGSDQLAAHRVLARHESLAENLRLLYVAVTRAKKRCYLVWGRIRSAETSALAYLLHLSNTAGEADVLAAMQQRFAALDNDDLLADLHKLAERSENTISIEMLPDRPETRPRPNRVEDKPLACPAFCGQIESRWKIASFSAMVSRQPQDAALPDHDVDLQLPDASRSEALEEDPPAAADRHTIFNFPRGARAGIFFHDLLEHLDFSPASEPERTGQIRSKLQQYGYERRWQITVHQAVENLLRVRLPSTPAGGEGIFLSNVASTDRVNEMDFTFPQKPIRPEGLAGIFSRHGGPQLPTAVPGFVQGLSFSSSGGFLTGYIDMLFMHGGRFYLLDWKSNHLGHRRKDYSSSRLAEVMVSEHYILQYCLYTVAANRYLQQHRPGYAYSTHFGGVFYVFIRGVDAAAGPATGIYYDRPDPGLIRALDEALLDI